MVGHQTDNYIKACMKTWLLCESCIHAELNGQQEQRINLLNEWKACAKACFEVVSRLVSNPDDMDNLPLNCLLHCRQCAEECEKYPDEIDIVACGEVCTDCAETIKQLTIFSAN